MHVILSNLVMVIAHREKVAWLWQKTPKNEWQKIVHILRNISSYKHATAFNFFFVKGRNMGYKYSSKHLVCHSINFKAIWAQTSSSCNFFCPRGSHIYEMLENYFQVSIFRIFSLFLRKIVQNTKKIKNQNGLIT